MKYDESDDSRNKIFTKQVSLPPWARWLLFLPGALAVAALVFIVSLIVQRLTDSTALGWLNAFILQPMFGGYGTLWFIMVGAAIAPARRKEVAVLLAIISLTPLVLNALFILRGGSYPMPFWLPRLVLDVVAMVVGMVIGVIVVWGREKST